MAKKVTKKDKEAKKARMAEKNAKIAAKSDTKTKKMAKKMGGDEEDDMSIDEILASYAKQQEEFQAVTITNCDPPSRRVNGTMVASPVQGKRELFLFGGETTVKQQDGPGGTSSKSNGGVKKGSTTNLAVFYNDLFSYSPDTDQWKKITSPNSPLPRSGHSMCVHPSGIVLMFGGEFSSPKQTTFYHYGDTWILDAQTKEWTKIEVKKGPTGRSGHRMTYWKNYILLHGGFRDLSTAVYLNDLWAFDVTSYKWHQVEFPPTHMIPDPRSGHSFVPSPEGGVIWGGYSKVKAGKGLQKGKVHTDSWLLKMKPDLKGVRWERRKKAPFAPSPRVGCSMVYHRGRGVLFGGVFDTEETEESLESIFYNNLYAYQIEQNKWFSLSLRAARKRAAQTIISKAQERAERDADLEANLSKILEGKLGLNEEEKEQELNQIKKDDGDEEEEEAHKIREYPVVTALPHPRFNVTSCVVDDTLFLFGGVWERGEREFHLDSLYSVDLGKLDGLKVYWENLEELEENDEEEDEEDEEDDDYYDEEEEESDDRILEAEEDEEEEEEDEKEPEGEPDPRPWLPHPKPFETLRAFYQRTQLELTKWVINNDTRGKDLKKAAFDLAEDRWWERREEVRVAEDQFEEMGGVEDVVERDPTKPAGKSRR
ncbi:hypothetical protein D0Z00_003850 [Geotrichum galactomycetum]|uniref:Uncharacterized protein n=1 Tax=Geotrichum galactomycetum TaxID=27317 RepID=A0ACB6V061_9ASCO|nr:hypothetical protein D0Z00_003850 [Geotrichum candidum]